MNRILLVVLTLFSLTAHSQGTQTVKIRSCAICPVNYEATTVRNLATYPLGTTGRLAFHAAVTAGTFNLNVPNGAVIPAGTKPPKLVPSPPVVNWLTVIRYSYNTAKRLDVEAAGQPVTAKFDRVDGQAFVGQSSGGQPLNSGVAYGPGSLSGPSVVNQEWSFLPNATAGTGIPAVPIRITFTHVATGATVWYVVTPVLGATKLLLTGTLPPAPVACNLNLTANTQTVACGGSATLTATASGTSSTGLSYNWSGNGASGNTASINVTAPSSNGTFSYTVTASKAGCTSVSAVAQVVVTGCGSGTTPTYVYSDDNFNYTPLAASSTTDKFPVFETNDLKLSLALNNQPAGSFGQPGLGGGIYKLYDKSNPGKTLIQNALVYQGQDNGAPRTGPNFSIGTGSGLSECLYQMPIPFYHTGETGVTTSATNRPPGSDPGLGVNPNEVGDDVGASGRLITYGRSTNTFYTESTPMLYGQISAPASFAKFRKWGTVEGRWLHLHYESIFNRTDNWNPNNLQVAHAEAPCLYVPGSGQFVFYDGNNPYSGDGLSTRTLPGNPNGNGGGLPGNGLEPSTINLTEPWVGYVNSSTGRGIFIVNYENHATHLGYWGDGGGELDNVSAGGSYGYMNNTPFVIFDNQYTYRHRNSVFVGTVAEFRAAFAALGFRAKLTPEYRFNKPGTRQDWYFNAGGDRHTWDLGASTITAKWKVFFDTGPDACILSPVGAWKAQDFAGGKLYVRMAYSGAQTQWKLKFIRNRQKADGQINGDLSRFPDGTADRSEQEILFGVQGDGVMRTYEINLSSKAEFKNVINQFKLYPHPYADGRQYGSGEYVELEWVSTNANGPAQNDLSAWWSIALLMSLAAGTAIRRRTDTLSKRSRNAPLAVRSRPASLSIHRQTLNLYGRS